MLNKLEALFFGPAGDRITKAGITICGIAAGIIIAARVWGC